MEVFPRGEGIEGVLFSHQRTKCFSCTNKKIDSFPFCISPLCDKWEEEGQLNYNLDSLCFLDYSLFRTSVFIQLLLPVQSRRLSLLKTINFTFDEKHKQAQNHVSVSSIAGGRACQNLMGILFLFCFLEPKTRIMLLAQVMFQ